MFHSNGVLKIILMDVNHFTTWSIQSFRATKRCFSSLKKVWGLRFDIYNPNIRCTLKATKKNLKFKSFFCFFFFFNVINFLFKNTNMQAKTCWNFQLFYFQNSLASILLVFHWNLNWNPWWFCPFPMVYCKVFFIIW